MSASHLIKVLNTIFGESLKQSNDKNDYFNGYVNCKETVNNQGYVKCEFALTLTQGILVLSVANGELKNQWKPFQCGKMYNLCHADIMKHVELMMNIDCLLSEISADVVIKTITEYENMRSDENQSKMATLVGNLCKTHQRLGSESAVKELLEYMKGITPNSNRDTTVAVCTVNAEGTASRTVVACEKTKAGRFSFSLDYTKTSISDLQCMLWTAWIDKGLYSKVFNR